MGSRVDRYALVLRRYQVLSYQCLRCLCLCLGRRRICRTKKSPSWRMPCIWNKVRILRLTQFECHHLAMEPSVAAAVPILIPFPIHCCLFRRLSARHWAVKLSLGGPHHHQTAGCCTVVLNTRKQPPVEKKTKNVINFAYRSAVLGSHFERYGIYGEIEHENGLQFRLSFIR